MISALFCMAALAVVGVAAILIPLWGPPRRALLGAADSNLALWRAEKRALDAELAAGTLAAEEHARAMAELKKRAAPEVQPAAGPLGTAGVVSATPAGSRRALAVVLALVVCAAAVGLYSMVGDPGSLSADSQEARQNPAIDPRVLAMVDSLAAKMRQHPDDLKGWALLAKSNFQLQRYGQAVDAYQRAVALAPRDARLLSDYADALAMEQNGDLGGRPMEQVQQALAINPDEPKALELAGSYEVSRHNARGAITYWERLYQQLPADSPDANQVAEALVALRAEAGLPPAPASSGLPPGAGPASAGTKTAGKGAPGTASRSDPARGAADAVSGHIELAAGLMPKVSLADTVFVFARAADPAGGRMPLAVMRFSARELPRDFELTDATAMAPGHDLSSVKSVIVEARISKSGNATPSSGDLVGHSAAVAPGAAGVHVEINATLP